MVDIREVIHGWKPVMVMVVVQIGYSIMNILNKLTVNDGMNMTILVAYRMVFAAAFIVPLALIVERKRRPKLTWMILFQASLSGLFGVFLTQNLFITSLYLTSATFVTAIINLIPAATFIMAICFRMENVKLETRSGKAKILGTIIGIGGAMIFTFYKGPEINIWSTKVNLLHHGEPQNGGKGSHNYFLGFLSALGSCLTYAVWLIVQTKMGERYPCQYSSTALISMIGLIQCVVLALCTQKDWKEWKLGWNIRLYTSIYSGIVVSGLVISLVTWCVVKRGPVFVSVFYPLLLLLTAIGEFLVLDEKLHCGSIVGATLIAGGLYLVLWGKNKEIKKAEIIPSQSLDESELADQIVHDGDSSKKDQETIAIEESIR